MIRLKIKKSQLKKLYGIVCTLIVFILVAVFAPDYKSEPETNGTIYTDYPFSVSFIDVGQGDCQLISCEGYNILVDGGEAENSGKVIKYLRSNNVEKIDCYILSHPHSDHIGAAENIIRNIDCEKLLTTYFSEFNIPTTKLYESLLDCIYENSVEAIAVEAGDSYSFGELEIEILAPFVESEDYNDMSIVFTATYKDSKVLFTGDATTKIEDQILEAGFSDKIDVLKVAHHGSTTSSSEEFLKRISPEYAVISCGTDNSYGHPHDEILNLLNNYEIDVFRTDKSGTIVYYGDGNRMNIEAIG